MIDLMKKVFLTGVGVASLTGEKIEELAKELREKGEMSRQEGEKFVADAKKKAEESREAMRCQVEKAVKTTLATMPLAGKDDIANLQKEVEKLRAEVEGLRKKSGSEEKK